MPYIAHTLYWQGKIYPILTENKAIFNKIERKVQKYPTLYQKVPYIDKFENTLNCMIPYIVKKKNDNVGHFADNKGYFRP